MHGALYCHLCKASEDTEQSSNNRCMFEGSATKLSSDDFTRNIGLMLHALERLKDLSKRLQYRDITLSHAEHDRFLARQLIPGQYYKQAVEAVEHESFHWLTVQNDSKQKSINPHKFNVAFTDNMCT